MKAVSHCEMNNGKNYHGERELHEAYSVVAVIKGELKEVVTARIYVGRSRQSERVYASIWVHGPRFATAGNGWAGGWGYHKVSAALQEAISSAGIVLQNDEGKRTAIDGCGDSAMRNALEAIARAAGARGKLMLVTH
jgi:hypothetical protein